MTTPHLPSSFASQLTTLSLFCKVVDNYGDIGICWRLAQQFQHVYQLKVTLWVDDLHSFHRLRPDVATDQAIQWINHITVKHWQNKEEEYKTSDITDIVIEFFGCSIPSSYIQNMAKRTPAPIWINLEGLSAEDWVEGCHMMPSPHPFLPLTKYFFFPGFTRQTGGLLYHPGLFEERDQFQQNHARTHEFFRQLGLTKEEIGHTKISLFCYPHAPLINLLETWQQSTTPIICLIPEGVATKKLTIFLQQEVSVGSRYTTGALTIYIIPFLNQEKYDQLLWACDINFVRGEDSFVRAQWANKPFIWHIYPQEKALHHKKLQAFLNRTEIKITSWLTHHLIWNDVISDTFTLHWKTLQKDLPALTTSLTIWQNKLTQNGDFVHHLMLFCHSLNRT